jgi:uncharacterized protein VirK/YbjX
MGAGPGANKQLLEEKDALLARLQGKAASLHVFLASSLGYEQKQEGEWTIIVRDDAGAVLGQMAFTIGRDASGIPNV